MARAAFDASGTGVPGGPVYGAAPTGAPVLPISLVWSEVFIDRFTADVAAVDASSVLRLGRRCVRRWLSRHGGFGFHDWCSWDGGRLVSCIDGGYGPEPPITFVADEPLLIFSAMVAGDHCYTVHGAKPLVLAGPGLSVTVAPVGSTITLWIPVDVHQQGVVGFFRADRFAAFFGLEPGDLQQGLEGIGVGLVQPRIQFNAPLGQGASECVAQAIGSVIVGEARAVYLWAKMAELVAWALHRGADDTGDGVGSELALALAAKRQIDEQPGLALELARLARRLGTHPDRLEKCFRQVHGVTMKQYCLSRRMLLAKLLLSDHDLTVSQVAERVGYGQTSSFSAAFRGCIGMSPRAFRRQAEQPLGGHVAPVEATVLS